jgi:hypothetical protein
VGHRPERIAILFARAPGAQLRGKVGRGLPRERGVAPPRPLSARPMARGAGFDAAFGIAFKIENRRCAIVCRFGSLGRHRQLGIIGGKTLARRPIHPLGDRAHLRVPPLAAGEEFQLPCEIAGVEACEARREVAVTFAAQAVAGDAGRVRSRVAAAQRDQLAGRFEAVVDRLGRGAGAKRGKCEER